MRLIDADKLIELIKNDKIDSKSMNIMKIAVCEAQIQTLNMACDRHIKMIKEQPTCAGYEQWVPCSERLPEPDSIYKDDPTYYLVQDEYGDMMVAKFIKFPGGARVWQQIHQYGAIMEDVVAWMPSPKPWKGEKNEDNT